MKRAGEMLVDLIKELGGNVPDAAARKGDLDKIHSYLLSRSQSGMICEDQWTFLKDILRAAKYSCRAINNVGANEFIAYQTSGALDELPEDSGFVQFAFWAFPQAFWARYRCLRYEPIRTARFLRRGGSMLSCKVSP